MAADGTPTPGGPGGATRAGGDAHDPRRRGLLLPIAVAALGLIAIGVAEDVPTRHAIEASLADRSGSALRVAGLTDATVSFTGRDGTVYVHSTADAQRALAIVRAQTGVRAAHVVIESPAGGGPTTPASGTGTPAPTVSVSVAPGQGTGSPGPSIPGPSTPVSPSGTPTPGVPPSSPPSSPLSSPPTPPPPTSPAELQKQLNLAGEIRFKTGSAVLSGRSTATLARVAAILAANPSIRIQIQGNTDSAGSAALNLALSKDRARAVYNALRVLGIDASRMTTIGYGETHPKVPNTSAANRAINRRVDFAVVG